MDGARRSFIFKAGGAALLALASAAAFAAYLSPDMLVSAWNAIRLCF